MEYSDMKLDYEIAAICNKYSTAMDILWDNCPFYTDMLKALSAPTVYNPNIQLVACALRNGSAAGLCRAPPSANSQRLHFRVQWPDS